MTERDIHFDCSGVARDIANSTVGLCKLCNVPDGADAISAGSGALVSLGSIDGILTAAHVLKKLPDKGKIGLIRFSNQPTVVQRQMIDTALAEKVIISTDTFGPTGPDLGFLRLPPSNVGNLRATNTFLNMVNRRRAVRRSKQPPPPYFDAVCGVVDEWTNNLLPRLPSTRLKGFQLLFGGGKVIAKYEVKGFDLCTFEVSFEEGLTPPSSYEGLSGGGLWRVYFEADRNGQNIVREKRLLGIAFYQYTSDGKQFIICHGPRSVYERLIKKVVEKWPELTIDGDDDALAWATIR